MSEVGTVRAPAKLTLSLRVRGVRADGYHDLSAEMLSIDLCDELTFASPGEGLEIVFESVTPVLAADDPANLVTRTLSMVAGSARVHLVKRIPVGGGLGGGSTDAGAVLRWAGCDDLDLAARLGADVPFCVRGGRAQVEGIGERLTPLPWLDRSFVLLVPPIGVDTAAVYRAWDDLPASRQHAGADDGENDLVAAALMVAPELAWWRDLLSSLTGESPRLAGSGATWFVEGTPEELGLDERRLVGQGSRMGRLIPVRTVGSDFGAVTRVS
jgi:4-diphosphocytidyl-2-C-methyl-D-erythritol kinase